MKHSEYLHVDAAREALSFIDPPEAREQWIRIGKALIDEYGDAAFDIWDEWSAKASNYKERDARTVWRSLGRMSSGKTPVTIATVIYEAKNKGWRPGKVHTPSKEELAARQREREERRAEGARLAAEDQAAAAAYAVSLWEGAAPANDNHPYLVRKGVPARGLRFLAEAALPDSNGEIYTVENALLVPVYESAGVISSLQVIGPNGRKTFVTNGKTWGCYAKIGNAQKPSVVVIAEGYATAASVHLATDYTVVVAFNAGNVPEVARLLREKLPDTRLIIAADNDYHQPGELDEKGRNKRNAGVLKALEAAEESGCEVVFPPSDGRKLDFNDLHISSGLPAVAAVFARGDMAELAREITRVPDPEPVATVQTLEEDTDTDPSDGFFVLGYNEDLVYLLPRGAPQVQAVTARSLTENGLLKLASLSYWETNFPHSKLPFDKVRAVDAIFRAAHAAGVFDPRRIRGRGAWRDGQRFVFHFGDHLLVDGQRVDLQRFQSDFVYPAALPFPRLTDRILTNEEGAWLLSLSERFPWTVSASAALLVGWCLLSPVCGALPWRPHVWLTGGPGCGKTSILKQFVMQLTAGTELFANGNSTEAGVRQEIRGDAVPVLFDEGEQNDEREIARMQAVLSLIRQSSSDSGAKTYKGTANGRSLQFNVRSMFCLASVMVGIKHQADRERLTLLVLRAKPEAGSPEVEEAAARWATTEIELNKLVFDPDIAKRLFRRSLELLPVILRSVEVFVAQASLFFGNKREGDQYGTLLAGAWCLLHDREPTPGEANDMISGYDWSEFDESTKLDDSNQALAALLEVPLRNNPGGEYSVYELVNKVRKGHDGEGDVQGQGVHMMVRECDVLLQRNSLRVKDGHLLVNPSSEKLKKALAHTKYGTDLRGYLKRIKGVTSYPTTVRMNGSPTRCLAIPLSLITD